MAANNSFATHSFPVRDVQEGKLDDDDEQDVFDPT